GGGKSRAAIGGTFLASLLLAACTTSEPEIDWSFETPVRADTPAGDHRGVTGTVERFTATSDRVTTRDVEVWLPSSYASQPDRRYPVLYMHDGQNLFDPTQSQYSGWDWGVDEAMTALGLDAIVVGVHSDSETRGDDYLPQKAGLENPDAFLDEIGELTADNLNADDYLRFLVEEIKPRIDSEFRTKPDCANTSVMGSSAGALISLYAISEYPGTFCQAGMVSAHFPLGNGALVDWFADHLPDPATHRLYFDYGTETLDYNYEPYQDRMDVAVEAAGYERGVNWTTRKYEGDDHSERAWRNRVHVPLQFLLTGESVEGGEER
ncbi:MAG: alpha/beta hydrolase-fold protein, partial [Litorimonas sp.]